MQDWVQACPLVVWGFIRIHFILTVLLSLAVIYVAVETQVWRLWNWLVPNWRRQWHPTPVLLPGKSHGRRSLVSCSPWGRYKLDTTKRLHFHFSLSCIGGGNGNPLQCSCLENPRDGGAWWAAVYVVAQSQTRLKWLSNSSSAQLLWQLISMFFCSSSPLWMNNDKFLSGFLTLKLLQSKGS